MLVLEEFTIQYPTGPWHLIVSILQLSKGKSTQRLVPPFGRNKYRDCEKHSSASGKGTCGGGGGRGGGGARDP